MNTTQKTLRAGSVVRLKAGTHLDGYPVTRAQVVSVSPFVLMFINREGQHVAGGYVDMIAEVF